MKTFEELSKINVGEFIEKKGRFSYLSWCDAASALLKEDSKATWTYGEPQHWGQTVIVFCTVFAFDKSMTAQLPVMDNKNKAIDNPNAFDVNTAMQRCLAKAIALHGIGLYIYRGEDFPTDDEPQQKPAASNTEHPMRNWAVEFLGRIKTASGVDDLTELISTEENSINDCSGVMVNEFKKSIHAKTSGSFKWPTYLKGK